MAIERISIDIRSNMKEIEQQLGDIDKRLKELKNNKPTLQIRADYLDKTKQKISDLDLSIKKLQAQKAEIKINGDSADTARSKIKETDNAIKILQARKARLQVTTESLKGADTDLKRLDKEMTSLNNKKARLQVQSEDLKQAESETSRLRDKLFQIGNTKTKITIDSNIEKVGNSLDSLSDKMFGVLNPFTSKINQWVGFGAVTKGVDSAVNMITGSIDGAINRMDTLNNASRVFENMGVDAKVAEKETENLKDAINGLPTPLDEAISSTQLLTSSTKDMGKSVKIYKALNDGILGFGGSAENVDSAVMQLSQEFSSGTIGAQTFNSMLKNNLGPVLDAMAEKMGIATADLKAGLSDGTISVEEFQDALIDLDENGGGSLQSLEKIASDSTKGIKTSISNMKTAVSRGVADVIGNIDSVLEKAGFGGFSGVFGQIGKTFEGGLNTIGDAIKNNEKQITAFLQNVGESAKKIKNSFKDFDWKSFFKGLGDGFKSLAEGAKSLAKALRPLLDVAKNIITKFGNGSFAEGLGKILPTFIKFAIASKVLGKSMKVLGKLKVPNLFSKLFGGKFGKKKSVSGAGESMLDTFKNLAKGAGNLALVYGTIKVIEEAAEAMQQLDRKVPTDFKALGKKLGAMGVAIGAMGGIVLLAGKLPKMQMVVGGAMVAGVAVELMIVAKSLKQLDEEVPENIGDVTKKMGSIAVAIGGIAIVSGAIGVIMSTGVGAIILGGGALMVVGLALELMLIAEAIKQFDEKVPEDISSINKKMESMAEVIKGIAKLGDPLLLVQTVFATIDIAVASVAINKLIDIAEDMERLDEIDVSGSKKKLVEIKEALEVLTGTSFTDMIKSFFELGETVAKGKTINAFVEIAKAFEEIEKTKFDAEAIGKKIEEIEKIVNNLGGEKGLFSKFKDTFGSKFDASSFESAKETITNIVQIANLFEKLTGIEIDKEEIESSVKLVTESLESIANIEFDKGSVKAMNRAVEAINSFNVIINSLSKITDETLNKEGIETTINNVEDAINRINGLPEAEGLENIHALVESFKSLIVELNGLAEQFQEVGKNYGDSIVSGYESANVNSLIMKKINKLIKDLKDKKSEFAKIGKSWGTALKNGFASGINGMANKAKAEINKLKEFNADFTTMGTNFGNSLVNGFNVAISNMSNSIATQVTNIQNQLDNLNGPNLNANVSTNRPSSTTSNNRPIQASQARRLATMTEYYSSGGLAGQFVPKGTDIVPAMLTPGEYVQNRQAVEKFGSGFMDRVNNLDVAGTFNQLTGRFGTQQMVSQTVSNMTNNVRNTHNTNASRINQYITSNNPKHIFKRSDRYARALR